MKTKRGRGVWYSLFVNTGRKIEGAEASWVCYCLQNYRTCVVPSTGAHTPESNSWSRTTEDASPKCAYLVLRSTRRPNIKSPDYLPDLLGSLGRDGNAESKRSLGKKFEDIFFQVISVEKRIIFHRTNCCLGCVGCVYVGRIYQNRGGTLLV